MQRALLSAGLLGTIVTGFGCGNDNDGLNDVVLAPTVTATSTTSSTTTTTTRSATANVVVNSVLLKAVPRSVTSLRLTGSNSAGTVLYGPATQNKAQSVTFSGVPVDVTSVKLEYLSGSELVGVFTTPVQLTADGTVVLNDPNYQAVQTPVATTLTLLKTIPAGFQTDALADVSVQVLDQYGAPLSGATVTASLASGPAGATLSGTTTQTSANGIASFPDLHVSAAGDYTLAFSVTGAAAQTSNLFSIAAAGTDLASQFLANISIKAPSVFDAFPDLAGIWDIYTDFTVDDGLSDAFDTVSALQVGGTDYAATLAPADLTFLTPLFSAAELLFQPVVSTTDPLQGTASALFPPVTSSRIEQNLDLSAATGAVTLTFQEAFVTGADYFGKGTQLEVLVQTGTAAPVRVYVGVGVDNPTIDLSAYAGQQVKLTFHATNVVLDLQDRAAVDEISVTDATSRQFVVNGGFESANFNGWTTSVDPQSQFIRTAPRDVNGLQVTRSAFSAPGQLWLRYYDEFTNNGTVPVTTTITYLNNLGSDNRGLSAYVEGTNNQAIWSSDASTGLDNNVGFVFGSGATLSATALTTNTNDPNVTYQNFTVQPGQTRAICFYVLQSGQHSGGAVPTEIVSAAQAIYAGAKTQAPYTTGLTATQIARIANF